MKWAQVELEGVEHCLTVLGQDLVFPASERAGRVKDGWNTHLDTPFLSVSPYMLTWGALLEKES